MFRTILVSMFLFVSLAFTAGCDLSSSSSASAEREVVERQQDQYLIGQPVPVFDWSLERNLIIQLYQIRNQRVATHSVWRSDYGIVEGDCPSIGYGLPYDTSLTNPSQVQRSSKFSDASLATIGQAEPNGIYASTNTSATWIMCVDSTGSEVPVYVESKVTAYPYPVTVDYETNRVTRAGESSVTIQSSR